MQTQKNKITKYTKKVLRLRRKLILPVFIMISIMLTTSIGAYGAYLNEKEAYVLEEKQISKEEKQITVNDTSADNYISIMEEDCKAEREKAEAEEKARLEQEEKEKAKAQAKTAIGKPYVIRCTGYCDVGYMCGGKWTYNGAIAGKYEWLGRTCNLYRVNKDGSMGELIGSYTFEDTGNGINGSLKKGTSVDVWHPSEDAVWDWIREYGDYVYIEFTS